MPSSRLKKLQNLNIIKYIALLGLILAPSAMAQDTASSGMEEIIITATKRAQTLQQAPIAVSVINNDTIEKAEIQDVFDLQSIVPSLEVAQSASTISSGFSIRGFGGITSNAGIEPSVGVFIDGIYRSRSSAQISDLLNIERVEVLRGPQSTLFGKNASVGVVSLVTKAPEFEQSGSLAATLGNFNSVRLDGSVTGPINDIAAFRLSARLNTQDGYATNLATGGDVNDRRRWGVQGQLLFKPNDDLSIRIIGDFDNIEEICCYAANTVSGPSTDTLVSALGQFVDEDPFSYEFYSNIDPTNDVENGGISVHIDQDYSFADLTSITSYRTGKNKSVFDADFTSADLVTSLNEGEIDTFTQEFRLTSNNPNAHLHWLVGAFFFDETIEFPGELTFGSDLRPFLDGALPGINNLVETVLQLPPGIIRREGQGVFENRGQDNQSYSLFGTADWKISNKLTATLGLGYINDEKDAFFTQDNTDTFSQIDLVAAGFGIALAGLGVNPTDPAAVAAFAAANPGTFAAIQSGAQTTAGNFLLALQPVQTLRPTLSFPNAVEDGHTDDDKLTYSLRLAYEATDSINVYASYSTGYKATSWNLSRDSRPPANLFIPGSTVTNPPSSPIRDAGLAVPNLRTGSRFAGPEESEVLELGVKIQNDSYYANLAIFDQSIDGFQSNVFTGDGGFFLDNAGEQSTTGLEIDSRWFVTDNITLTFAGTFLNPNYDSFPASRVGDLTGQTPAGITETSTSTAVEYGFSLRNNPAFVRADWQYSSETPYTDDPSFQALTAVEREYNLLNVSAGMTLPKDIRLTVWGRNVLGEEYLTRVFPPLLQTGSVAGFPNPPATYGITVRKSF